jgi:hypothetical protein
MLNLVKKKDFFLSWRWIFFLFGEIFLYRVRCTVKARYGSSASNKKRIIISATKTPRKVKAKLI